WAAAENCEVFFSIGTAALVQPAASLPLIAANSGATVIEVNPQPTPLTAQMDFVLPGPAGKILPRLVAALQPME
ncbi:MAG TPA: NAD-dependent protein deacylase, partial [Anaerolineales bacterium]|nr:NAD-dependent protein deacylase [Anaerolineales bacterium]